MLKTIQETKSEKLERYLKEPKRKLAEKLVNVHKNLQRILKERNEYYEMLQAKNNDVQADVIKSDLASCDVCGNHPNIIITTQFGRYCQSHAKYV